jgi:hypothetical protein
MAGPIYKFFRGQFTEAWHQLSQEEQDSLLTKVNEALEQAGGKPIILCDTRWHSDQWMFAGVEEFPDIEAVQKHTELLNGLNWFHYVQSESMLGTAWEPA